MSFSLIPRTLASSSFRLQDHLAFGGKSGAEDYPFRELSRRREGGRKRDREREREKVYERMENHDAFSSFAYLTWPAELEISKAAARMM
jgi:hypothetical protein